MPNLYCLQNNLIEEILKREKVILSKDRIIKKKQELTLKNLIKINPKYIFFPHWSHLVPKEIFNNYECIAFHASPLPYGRGGSPIQNMIKMGFKNTKICAFKMNATIDGGPIYCQSNLSLTGDGEQIYKRLYKSISLMTKKILSKNIIPQNQKKIGIKTFKRLNYKNNEIPKNNDLKEIYDHIRMTDALDYPRAYINYGNLNISFQKPKLRKNIILSNVKITIKKNVKNKKS
tara:strand:- start:941 stop:1636 length:696 start_codon:yes stop_codon:yes gene_type:complete